jgi:hypothetical protein
MTARTDDVSVASPLVASCPTLKEARRTVEFICDRGVPREAVSVVAEGLRPACEVSEGSVTRSAAWAWCGWVAGALVGVVAGVSVAGPVVGALVAVLCGLCGGVATVILSCTPRWSPGRGDGELVMADRFYVVCDEASARTGRRLLWAGADARAPSFDVLSTPCVGSLPVRRRRSSNGEVTPRRRRAWGHRHPGTA